MRKLIGMRSCIRHDYRPSLLHEVSVVFSSHTHGGKPLYYIMECHHDTSAPFLPQVLFQKSLDWQLEGSPLPESMQASI